MCAMYRAKAEKLGGHGKSGGLRNHRSKEELDYHDRKVRAKASTVKDLLLARVFWRHFDTCGL